MEKMMVQEDLARKIAREGMQLVRDGNIRNHKLRNSSRIHTGEVEKKEYQNYRDFLPSKNFYMVYELTGSDEYE